MVAWEQNDVPRLQAFGTTVAQIVSSPLRSFAGLGDQVGFAAPLTFLLASSVISSLILVALRAGTTGSLAVELVSAAIMFSFALVARIAVPVIVAGVADVVFKLFGVRRRFDATFRAVAYSTGATLLLADLPIIGAIMAFVFMPTMLTIGFAKTVRTSWISAAAATVISGIGVFVVLVGFFVVLFAVR